MSSSESILKLDGRNDASKSDCGDDSVLNYLETPLNACSLESFCNTIHSELCGEQQFIPLCLGCYQLNEITGNREGLLELYASTTESFGTGMHPPLTILGDGDGAPGVLDGKWSSRLPSSSTSIDFHNYYATAHANGEIWVHNITNKAVEIANDGVEKNTNPFRATLAGKSRSPSENEGLCLALAWEDPLYRNGDSNCSTAVDTRIISSYSDGRTAIHRVREHPPTSAEDATQTVELSLEHHWDSHTIFKCPAEVWCANFIDSNTVVTGGDEGSWKVWDLRQPLIKPVYHGKNDFEAGVTVLSPHPRHKNLLAIGSYDETIALFDLRRMTTDSTSANKCPEELYHSEPLGGGIWRCKWHPRDDSRILVAAMHGGCVSGKFGGLDSANFEGQEAVIPTSISFSIQKQFNLHQSMAYGIDWLVYPEGTTEDTSTEAAASCSFYDKAMYLWKTGPENI